MFATCNAENDAFSAVILFLLSFACHNLNGFSVVTRMVLFNQASVDVDFPDSKNNRAFETHVTIQINPRLYNMSSV
jgi:hypothetical protein